MPVRVKALSCPVSLYVLSVSALIVCRKLHCRALLVCFFLKDAEKRDIETLVCRVIMEKDLQV
jgi:hypothetical protein